MRKQIIALTLGLSLGLATMAPRPAAALSCLHPHDQLPMLALIVKGKVEKIEPRLRLPNSTERPEDLTLQASWYLKGEGPTQLKAVFDGMGWERMNPIGAEVIMGFMLGEDGTYRADACTLRINAQPTNQFETETIDLIKAQYGEGKAPKPGTNQPESDGSGGQWLLGASLGALALLTGGLWLRRRAKQSR